MATTSRSPSRQKKTSTPKKSAAPKRAAAKKSAAPKKAVPRKDAAAKKGTASASKEDFGPVFSRLRELMRKHEGSLVVKHDEPGKYYVVSPKPYNKKELFFGAVITGKAYVSYHFFPLYVCPELGKSLSAELKKRRQGKACFNFARIDDSLFGELDAFTARGFEAFKKRELV